MSVEKRMSSKDVKKASIEIVDVVKYMADKKEVTVKEFVESLPLHVEQRLFSILVDRQLERGSATRLHKSDSSSIIMTPSDSSSIIMTPSKVGLIIDGKLVIDKK